MTTVSSATIELRGNVTNFTRSMQTASRRFKAMGQKMQRAGRTLATRVTLPILGIGIAAARASAQFETAMTGVAKTVDASEAEINRLGKSFVALSEEIPTSSGELAKIGELAGQLGVQTRNIESFTRTIAALGVSTNLSTEMAATSLARFSNIMGTSQRDVDRLGSTIVDLGNNLATTEAEITSFATRIAGAGRIAGLTEADVLAIGGALSSVGIQAEAGGTAVQSALIQMNTAVAQGNEDLAVFAETAGLSAQQFVQQWEEAPVRAFQSFIEGLGSSGDNATVILEDLFAGNQRLTRAFLALANAGDLLGGAIDRGNQAWADNTALTEEAEKFYDRLGAAFTTLRNKLSNVTAELGDAFRPAFDAAIRGASRMLNVARNMISSFAALSAETRKQVGAWIAMAAALSPVLIAVGTFVAFGVSLTGTLGTIVSFVNPVTLGLSAIGIALVQMGIGFDDVKQFALDAFDSILAVIKKFGPALFNAAKPALNFLIGAFVSLGFVAVEAVRIAIEGWAQLWPLIIEGASNSSNFLVRAFARATEEVARFARIMAFEIGSALGALQDSEDEAISALGDIGQRMADAAVAGFGRDYVGGIIEFVDEGVAEARALIERLRRSFGGGGGEDGEPGGFSVPTPDVSGVANRAGKAFERIKVTAEDTADSISSGFASAFSSLLTGTQEAGEAFRNFALGVISDLTAMIIRAALFNSLMGFFGGGGGASVAGGFSGLTGGGVLNGLPGRQHGGPVTRNRAFLVGERGPEVFVPQTSGMVLPNAALAGGGGASAGSIAGEILNRVGPPPRNAPPQVIQYDTWWRETFSLLRRHDEETR